MHCRGASGWRGGIKIWTNKLLLAVISQLVCVPLDLLDHRLLSLFFASVYHDYLGMQSSVPSCWRYSITRTQCTHPPPLFIYLPPSTVWNHTPTTHAPTLRITTHHAYNLVQHSINNVKCSMLGYFAHNKIRNIRRHKGRTQESWRICEWTGPRIDTHTQYNLFYNAHRHRQHLTF